MMLAALVLCVVMWLTPWYAYAQKPQTTFNPNAPTARGLVGWWKAIPNFTNGQRFYDVLGLAHGQLVGTTWVTSTRPFAPQAIRTDGTTGFLEIPARAHLEPPSRSVLLWLRFPVGAPDYGTLFADTDTADHLIVFSRADNRFAVYMGTSVTTYNADPITAFAEGLVTGQWYHIAVTFSATAGQLKFYQNCVQTTPGLISTSGTLVASNLPTLFGALRDLGGGTPMNFLQADMDDIRIYNRAIPQQEICTIIQESAAGYPTLFPTSYTIRTNQPLGFVAAVVAALKSRFLYFFRKQ